ncbi:MAG: hypothetical protein WCQ50_15710 [Spirochaetota bacterium]
MTPRGHRKILSNGSGPIGEGTHGCLVEQHECEVPGVVDMPFRMPPGLAHIRLPIKDVSVPDRSWEKLWEREGPRIRAVLHRGGRVCVHCMGGLGRSGLVAAPLLVELGEDPESPIQQVRAARPGAIETQQQEDYVRSCGPTGIEPSGWRCPLRGFGLFGRSFP